ncbi:sensor histidine kinase [Hyalangium rubrum]|uniref:histidine kinase n=1 Tax=Hyalangium rubrum TaxID=3103134 RepID=A0ABU5HIK2_9BACT|nr:two-component regulator propeller domain-containing protein [Hyalangium sp. s54d21]MDY7233269.1 two-component regulator propeller domain-containing protein [Hyalangium sp. s54d21]
MLTVLALLGLFGWGRSAAALAPDKSLRQLPLQTWRTMDGLPENPFMSLAQTPDGYLWGSTWEELVRFDGVRFTTFDRNNTPEFGARSIPALTTSSDGTLWIGTETGLSGLRKGHFFSVPLPEGLNLRHVRVLCATRDGALWLGTSQKGLVRFADGRFQVWNTDNGLASNRVYALAEDKAGTLWVATNGGLQRWDGSALREGPPFEGSGKPVHALALGLDGTLWVGTGEGSVYHLQEGRSRPVPEASLPGAAISTLLVDRAGSLWVGSASKGLLRLANGQRSTLDASQGLLNDAVITLLEDAEGNIWISVDGGMHRLKEAPFTPYGRPEGVPHDIASALYEARDGSLWFASRGGGVTRWQEGRSSTWTEREGLLDPNVYAIAEGPDGSLWFGSQKGLSRWQSGAITLTLGAAQGLPAGAVRTVYVDDAGAVWLGTQAGLARWDGERVERFGQREGLPGDSITLVLPRREGGLWVTTADGGLASIVQGRIVILGAEGSPMYDDPNAILEESDGTLWIATDEGLYRWKAGRFTRLSHAEGLFNDRIFHILSDGRGNLWMSCNKGVFRVAQAELEAVADGRLARVRSHVYGVEDGMRSAECNGIGVPGGVRDREGRLWFPTTQGVVAYSPGQENQTQPQAPPPVLIEGLRVNRQPVPIQANGRVTVSKGDVEIHYTSPSLSAPHQLRFRYRLENFDRGWVEAGSRRVAYYTQLPPGNYRFRVRAESREGGPVSPDTTLKVYLPPRLHQTLAFRVACVLAVGLLVLGAVWLRLRQMRARERELKSHVADRTRELATVNASLEVRLQELQDTRERLVQAEKLAAVGTLAAGVGHEINNPLAYIISNLHYIAEELRGARPEGDPERWGEMEQALSEALQGADRVRRIVQELKTFSRAHPQEQRRVELGAVLEAALAMAEVETRLRARVVKDYGTLPPVQGDASRLEQVVLNLLINATQAIPEGHVDQNEIRVSARLDEQGRVVVAVSDTGAGIPADVLPRIFEPFFTTRSVGMGTGLGLSICHSYVQAMGGEIRVRSELGQGTTVEVVLVPAQEAVPEARVESVRGKASG